MYITGPITVSLSLVPVSLSVLIAIVAVPVVIVVPGKRGGEGASYDSSLVTTVLSAALAAAACVNLFVTALPQNGPIIIGIIAFVVSFLVHFSYE